MKKLLTAAAIAFVVLAILAARPLMRGKGQIATDTPGVELILHGPWGFTCTITSPDEPRTVRAGVYRPAQLHRTIQREPASGSETAETWQMYSTGPWGDIARIDVNEGQATILSFNAPATAGVNVDIVRPYVNLGLRIVGPNGEHYDPVIRKNGRNTAKPKLTIFDEAGSQLHAGSFEFG